MSECQNGRHHRHHHAHTIFLLAGWLGSWGGGALAPRAQLAAGARRPVERVRDGVGVVSRSNDT